jgi:hypothetical protein
MKVDQIQYIQYSTYICCIGSDACAVAISWFTFIRDNACYVSCCYDYFVCETNLRLNTLSSFHLWNKTEPVCLGATPRGLLFGRYAAGASAGTEVIQNDGFVVLLSSSKQMLGQYLDCSTTASVQILSNLSFILPTTNKIVLVTQGLW